MNDSARLIRGPVLDFHVRLAPRPGADDALLRLLDECGIARAVVCAGGTMDRVRLSRQVIDGGHVETDADNDTVLRAAARSAGRLVPFHFANPHRGPDPYRAAAGDVAGVELSPAVHGVRLDDPRVGAIVAVAKQFHHPVYVACLSRAGCTVADLVALSASFPDVTFVLGHTGIGNIDYYGVELVADRPNVLVETSGGYSSVLAFAVERLGPQRLLFGTEAPLHDPRVELTKYAVLRLPEPAWHQISWANAARLLALEPVTPAATREWRHDDIDPRSAPAAR